MVIDGPYARKPPQRGVVGPRKRGPDRPHATRGGDLRGRAVGHDRATRHDDDPIGEGVRLLEIVRGEHHGLALGRHASHGLPEVPPSLDVDGRGRLVEHEEVGIGDQRQGEADPLGLPAGELVRPTIGERACPRELEHLVDREGARVHGGDHRDELADAQVLEERTGLQHPTDDPRRHGFGGRHPEQGDAARNQDG